MLTLKLPAGYRTTAAHWLNPTTLEVTPIETAATGTIAVPSVDVWSVLVVDLTIDAGAKTLAEQFGPPKTFHTPRPGLKVNRNEPLVLDLKKSVEECERDLNNIAVVTGDGAPAPGQRDQFEEEPELKALDAAARNAGLARAQSFASELGRDVQGRLVEGGRPAGR